jgi:hypothetical protein
MPNESDDSENEYSSLDELKELIDEIKEEITGNQRKELFKMSEFFSSFGIRTEVCRMPLSSDKTEFAIVIPISQFKALRKVILNSIK